MGASHHVQRSVQSVLRKHIGSAVQLYIDDVVIGTVTREEFLTVLGYVINAFQAARLVCKTAKCMIGCYSLRLLGHIVDGQQVRIADDKRTEVASLPFPENPKQLRAALGQTNFQRAFIPDYATITKPLTALVNGTTAQMRTPEARAAWRQLMEAVANQMSLYHLDYDEQIRVRVDASILGVGGALFNVGVSDGIKWERLVAVCSHAFNETERNWATIEQEAFAMVFACRYWFPLLVGVRFVLDGDHRNLAFIHGGSSPKVVRWSLFMQGLDYVYNHIAGVDNFFPDRLSRQEFRETGLRVPDLEEFGIPEEELGGKGHTGPQSNRMMRALLRSRGGEASEAPTEVGSDHQELIAQVHSNGEGHHGIHRTVALLQSRGQQWPKMGREVAEFIERCVTCQKNRPGPSAPSEARGTLRQYTMFAEVSIDFIGPLPKDQLDNQFICGCTCGFSGFIEAFPVEAATAVVAAHCLLSVLARYGAPQQIRSDRGTHFVNEIVEELLRMFKVTGIVTPPYRPQANGIEERTGGEVVRHLRALVTNPDARELWSVVLPLAVRIVNHTYKSWLGCRPCDLVHIQPGAPDRGLLDPFRPVNEVVPITTAFLSELHRAYERMLDHSSQLVLEGQKKLEGDRNKQATKPVNVGDLVLVRYPVQPPSKLHSRVAGPFRVVKRLGNLVAVKDLTCDRVIERDAEMVIQFRQPPGATEHDLTQVAAQDMLEHEVDRIVGHRGAVTKAKIEFLVQWKDGESSWETWKTVQKLAALDEYLAKTKVLKVLTGRKTLGAV
jgi:hypothetical protein